MPWGVAAAAVGAAGSVYSASKQGGSGGGSAALQPFTLNLGDNTRQTITRTGATTEFGQYGLSERALQDRQYQVLQDSGVDPQRAAAAQELFNQTNNNPLAQFNVDPSQVAAAQGFGAQQLPGALQGAGTQFNYASQDPTQARQQQLDLLRQQAQPYEQQQLQGLQNNLFSTGRLGTSGGGRNLQSFARGLGEADLSRQIQAGGYADSLQNSAANRGATLLQGAGGIAGTQQSLQDSQFGRQQAGTTTADQRALARYSAFGQYLDENSGRNAGLRSLADSSQYTQQALNLRNQNLSELGFALNAATGGAAAGANQANYDTQAANAQYGALTDAFSGIAGAGVDYYNKKNP